MRALLDSNIYVSYLLTPHQPGSIHEIFEAFQQGKFTLLLPEAVMDELTEVISNQPHLAGRIKPEQWNLFRKLLQSAAELVPAIEQTIPAIGRDAKDDYLLAYAVVGDADYLVTGDKDLLVLKRIADVAIITPVQFAALPASQTPPEK